MLNPYTSGFLNLVKLWLNLRRPEQENDQLTEDVETDFLKLFPRSLSLTGNELQRLCLYYIILLQAEPEKLHSQPESGNEFKKSFLYLKSATLCWVSFL